MSQSEDHPPSHKDSHRVGAKGQEKSSALTSQRPHQAFSRGESPRPLSREGAKEGKEREGRSLQKFSSPSEVASDNPLKKRKREDSGKTPPDRQAASRRLRPRKGGRGPAAQGEREGRQQPYDSRRDSQNFSLG